MYSQARKFLIKFTDFCSKQVQKKQPYQVVDSQTAINKVLAMSPDEQKMLTLSGVHYEDKDITEVKLSTGDIISVEAAIALAGEDLLTGFRAGRNARGDRTLRASPNYYGTGKNSIHNLPEF